MQFVVQAIDHTDPGAQARRMEAREAHVALISEYRAKGHMLMGAAMLDEEGKMVGSTIIVDFPDRTALDEWLEKEPYLKHNVWGEVEITPCAVGPSFLK